MWTVVLAVISAPHHLRLISCSVAQAVELVVQGFVAASEPFTGSTNQDVESGRSDRYAA